MTELTGSLPKRSTRRAIVYVTLVFCFSIITFVTGWGSETNSLHESALAWAFSTSIFVISGYVFGAVVDNWIEKK